MRQTQLGTLDVLVGGGTDGDGDGEGPVVVLLHGFGAPGDDLAPMGRELGAPAGTRFVFPAAPLSMGPEYQGGRAWWWIDMEARMRRRAAGNDGVAEVPEGLDIARAKVIALLDDVESKLRPPPGKIVLGGFSQGAMLSLDVALHDPRPLAGLLLMSATHIAADEWFPRVPSRSGLPVFMSHGLQDELLPFRVTEGLRDLLTANGLAVEFVSFRGGHAIPPQLVAGARAFLNRVLAAG